MTRIINVAGNSGSGKSVVAFNLGVALAQKGRDVILMDANIYNPDIIHYSGIEHSNYLNDFIYGEKSIEEAITYHPSGLKVIPSLPEEVHDERKLTKVNDALLHLIGKAEIVIVDSFSHAPALHSVLSNTDETIFVTNDDFASILKTKDFLNNLEGRGINVSGVILNRKRKDTDIYHVSAITGRKILAELPHSEKVTDSINSREAFLISHPNEKISKTISELADAIDLKK